MRTFNGLTPLPDNSILPALLTDGNLTYNEPLLFGASEITLFEKPSELPLINYFKIGTISGESCQILPPPLTLPPPIDLPSPFLPHCCLSFSYSRLFYLCLPPPHCSHLIIRLAKKLRMRCQKSRLPNSLETGPEVNYNKDFEDKHEEGYWAGYARYTRLGEITPNKPMYVVVSRDEGVINIRSYKESEEKVQYYKIINLEWVCESELPCSVDEYVSMKRIKKLKRQIDRVEMEMNLQSLTSCLALEIREKTYYFSQKNIAIMCPFESTQVYSLKMAIKNAYSFLVEQANIKDLPFALEGSSHMISIYNINEPEKGVISAQVRLLPNYIQLFPEKTPLIEYKDIKELGNVKCGLEFRNLSLPTPFVKKGYNPQCCFSFMKNKDRIFICLDTQLRCISYSRMILKRIKLDCMLLLSMNNQVSNRELDAINEDVEIIAEPDKSLQILEPPTTNDPSLSFDLIKSHWEGGIYYGFIERKDSIDVNEGFLKTEGENILIWKNNNERKEISYEKKIKSLFFACNTPIICHPSNYLSQISKFNDEYNQELLSKSINNFMNKLNDIKESNCFILEFEHKFFHYLDSYLICTKDKNQGFFLGQILSCRYDQILEQIKYDQNLTLQLDSIADISPKDIFPLKFYEENTKDVSKKKIIFI